LRDNNTLLAPQIFSVWSTCFFRRFAIKASKENIVDLGIHKVLKTMQQVLAFFTFDYFLLTFITILLISKAFALVHNYSPSSLREDIVDYSKYKHRPIGPSAKSSECSESMEKIKVPGDDSGLKKTRKLRRSQTSPNLKSLGNRESNFAQSWGDCSYAYLDQNEDVQSETLNDLTSTVANWFAEKKKKKEYRQDILKKIQLEEIDAPTVEPRAYKDRKVTFALERNMTNTYKL